MHRHIVSINRVNGLIGMNFPCDGAHYIDDKTFFRQAWNICHQRCQRAISNNRIGGIPMLIRLIDNLSSRAFAKVKWLLTALSGVLTTSLIVMQES